MPYLSYQYREADDGFGDYRLYDISPCEFISLIKYSKYIFTDSFHATAFSHLYKKEFVVFSPDGNQSRVRMDSLTEMFKTTERHLIGSGVSIDAIEHFESLDCSIDETGYIDRKHKSMEYLIRSLNAEA